MPFTIAWKCFSHKKGILGSKLRPFRFVSKSLFDNPFSTNPFITHEPLPFPCPRTLPLSSCYFFIQPKPFYSKILPQIRKFQLVSVCIAFIILNKNPIQSSIHNRTIKTKIYWLLKYLKKTGWVNINIVRCLLMILCRSIMWCVCLSYFKHHNNQFGDHENVKLKGNWLNECPEDLT